MWMSPSVPNAPDAFFGFSVARSLAMRALGSSQVSIGVRRVILAVPQQRQRSGEPDNPGRTLVVPGAAAIAALFGLLLDPGGDRPEPERIEILLPKDALLDLADRLGVDPVADLRLRGGAAAHDPVMHALNACFERIGSLAGAGDDPVAAGLIEALFTHLGERYGNMRKLAGSAGASGRGGLAPWQLRMAQRSLHDLESTASLAQIARDCGLSAGHFARAFKRSTGKSPHQWVLRRRIDAAKEMMGWGVPLAEIAVACRFSDQSHLTRAFSQATGFTPRKWKVQNAVRQPCVAAR